MRQRQTGRLGAEIEGKRIDRGNENEIRAGCEKKGRDRLKTREKQEKDRQQNNKKTCGCGLREVKSEVNRGERAESGRQHRPFPLNCPNSLQRLPLQTLPALSTNRLISRAAFAKLGTSAPAFSCIFVSISSRHFA